ncbi:MAG: GNAT family N-acetyltransferase [Desulfobacteraceae bacterium]|nr:GNAT family N-acetyltransferase [Desulfobacteraceae bacterium]
MGAPGEPHLLVVVEGDRPIGVAPLALQGACAHFLGSHEVCDYQDLVVAPGKGRHVLAAVMEHLRHRGITQLDFRTLRPDAVTVEALKSLAPKQMETALAPDEVTFEMALPDTWDGYLQLLDGKQRHEVRRKLRRLETHGAWTYSVIESSNGLGKASHAFVDLFRRNRADKAEFMSGAMVDYFQDLMEALASHGLLRLCFLDVDQHAVAAVLCFDYAGVRYLYNSGYDEQYEPLSVGILSKVLSIQHAVGMGCRRYDFLKGREIYKKRIGGQPVDLYRCRMTI